MKLFWTVLGLVVVAAAAYAGNLDTFVAPVEEVAPAEPMGGSSGWVVPLVALLVIAAIASSSSDDDDAGSGS